MTTSSSSLSDLQVLTGYDGTSTTSVSSDTTTDLLDEEVFLNLLITEMQYQDPLDPMENKDFVQQLASLTQVEQLRSVNTNLQTLQLYESSVNNAQSLSMIGKEVMAVGNTVKLDSDDEADINFNLGSAATKVSITITDSDGTTVRTLTQSNLESGDHSIEWDGTDRNGSPLPDGIYTFEVSATDADGESVTATTFIAGVVEGVSFSSGSPQLIIDGQTVSISDIYKVKE